MGKIITILFLVLAFLGSSFGEETKRTKLGYLVCLTAEDVLKGRKIASQGDKLAFTKMIVQTGRCNILKPGLEVYVMESRSKEGLVKIRLKGEVDTLWTDADALE